MPMAVLGSFGVISSRLKNWGLVKLISSFGMLLFWSALYILVLFLGYEAFAVIVSMSSSRVGFLKLCTEPFISSCCSDSEPDEEELELEEDSVVCFGGLFYGSAPSFSDLGAV